MAKNHGLYLLAMRAGAQERGEGNYVGPCLRCGTHVCRIDGSGFECTECNFRGLLRDLRVLLDTRPPDSFRGTDFRLAERMVEQFGEDICHVEGMGWLLWDGRRWDVDRSGAIMRLAKAAARTIWKDVDREADDATRAALSKWAGQSESYARLVAAEKLARTELEVVANVEHLDALPYDLNCLDGTIDLRTGVIRGHRRSDLITKLAPFEYDPSAAAPTWYAFLERVLPDVAVREYVQKAVGYSASGRVSEHVLFLMLGSGENGKSVFLRAMHKLLGDYARVAESGLLLAHRSDRHPTGIADLRGARFVSTSEPDRGRPLAESLVKQLTGGDRVTARRMRKDFTEFTPTWTIWMAANDRPEIRGTDHGIWRRVKLIPFDVTIPAAEQDRKIDDKLEAEMSGIMAWVVAGAVRYEREGLSPEPDAVRLAIAEYRSESDTLGRFIEERCQLSPTFSVSVGDLFDAWRDWCEQQGENPGSGVAFGRKMTHGPVERTRTGSSRGYAGIRLLDCEEISERSDPS